MIKYLGKITFSYGTIRDTLAKNRTRYLTLNGFMFLEPYFLVLNFRKTWLKLYYSPLNLSMKLFFESKYQKLLESKYQAYLKSYSMPNFGESLVIPNLA